MTNVVDLPHHNSGFAERTKTRAMPQLVMLLEDLLALAKDGKIRSLAAVTVEGPGAIGTCWAATDGWFHEITSGMEVLKFRWMHDNSGHGSDGGPGKAAG